MILTERLDAEFLPTGSRRGEQAWVALQRKYKKAAINQLGFMSHDRLHLSVLEAKQLKIPAGAEFAPTPPRSYRVIVEVG